MISTHKTYIFSIFLLISCVKIQTAEDVTTHKKTPSSSNDFLRIWESSKSSARYQEEQMKILREKMAQEKPKTASSAEEKKIITPKIADDNPGGVFW